MIYNIQIRTNAYETTPICEKEPKMLEFCKFWQYFFTWMLSEPVQVSMSHDGVLGMIKRSFEHLDMHTVWLFTTLIRLILEYSNSIWDPHFVLDQHKVEKIQCRATKMIAPLQDLTFEERLLALQLPQTVESWPNYAVQNPEHLILPIYVTYYLLPST